MQCMESFGEKNMKFYYFCFLNEGVFFEHVRSEFGHECDEDLMK
jgi:hypothetical protein